MKSRGGKELIWQVGCGRGEHGKEDSGFARLTSSRMRGADSRVLETGLRLSVAVFKQVGLEGWPTHLGS